MRRPSKREWALLALLPVVVLVIAGTEQAGSSSDAAAAESVRPHKTSAASRNSGDAGTLDLSRLRREATVAASGDAFESKSWYVPPPPPPQALARALPPPPPSAPPLPFTYLGRYEAQSTPVIFLARGDRVILVRAGDVIEGTYRVDGIVGSALGLTYLPMHIKQSLDIGHAG